MLKAIVTVMDESDKILLKVVTKDKEIIDKFNKIADEILEEYKNSMDNDDGGAEGS